MALNLYEKVILDNAVKKAVSEFVGDNEEVVSFTASELYDTICEELGFTLPRTSRNRSLDYSIKRCNIPCNRDGEVYYYDTYHIFMTEMPSLRKEKNRLYFDKMCNKEVYYDFATGTFNIENFLDKVLDTRGRKSIFADNSNFMTALKYEWLFNYSNSVRDISAIIEYCPKSLYEKMMPGLAEMINENNGRIDCALLREYYDKATYKKYYKFVSDLGIERTIINKFLEDCSFEILLKMIKNSFIEGEGRYALGHAKRLIEDYCSIKENGYSFTLDSNRSICYNQERIENLLETEKNNILAKQLQRLNFIHGYSNDKYIVIVPQSQNDKQEEGRMQNNCVGHYYDDSIIQGRNLIYFVRKKENPAKSYITCRYNIEEEATVEYRLKNNYNVSDDDDINFIREVSEIIKKELGE